MNTIKNDKEEIFSSQENLLMYYHTSMRNVGLFTSISITSLLASLAYLKNNKYLYNLEGIILYIISLVFIIITLLICDRIINTIKKHNKENNNKYIELLDIPRILYYVNIIFLFISFMLVCRIIYKNIIITKR